MLQIKHVEGPDDAEQNLKLLVFEGCRKVLIDANFGMSPPNSILLAREVADSDLLNESLSKWKGVGVTLPRLRHFLLRTNTTNSELNILAEKLLLVDDCEESDT